MVDVSILLDRADLLLQQDRHRDAEASIKQALEQEPENDQALSLLARCYFDQKKIDEGIEVILRAIALDPENSFYFYLLAFGYYQKDKAFAAIENLNKAIQLNPWVAEYYGLLAYVLIDEREFQKALDKANEGLAIDAENITCLQARSRALNKLNRTDDAIETMQNALKQDPDNESTHATVGWNYLEKGRHQEAGKHFREALRLDPNHASSKQGLKEALKSKLAPYRWLLQYSFWVNNKGKNLRTILPIALYIVFRVLISLTKGNESTEGLAWILLAVYLLFVVTSWTINSIANFMLLFHPDGKYAVTSTERWSAIAVVSAMITGLGIMILSQTTEIAAGTVYAGNFFFAGLLCLSLALPLSELEFPVTISGNRGWRGWVTPGLVAFGLFTLLLFTISPGISNGCFIVYGIAFIIYNWTGLGR